MKAHLRFVLVTACIVCLIPALVYATNRLEVESAIVTTGQQVTVGAYIENDVQLNGIVIPFVLRSVTNGAYPTAVTARFVAGSRMDVSGALSGLRLIQHRPDEDGTSCKGGQPGGFLTSGVESGGGSSLTIPAGMISDPDCIKISRNSVFPATPLAAGTDFPIGTGVPCFNFTFTAPSTAGSFKIDTTCTDPSGHILFVPSSGSSIVPEFTLGTIEVTDCDCPHQSDYISLDGPGSVDFPVLVRILYFNEQDIQDPGCPAPRGDFNYDGSVDTTDLLDLIRYLYFVGPPPCNPCNPVGGGCR